MAGGNLAISVRADTSEARAQLALVTADIGNVGKALRQAANDARGSGFDGVTDSMRQLAGQMGALRAEQAKLNSEMKEGSKSAFTQLNESVKKPLEALAMLKSSMRETAELAGAVFVVDKIREFVDAMGELGERAVNTAAALGTTAEQYQQLSESMQLVGGDADALVRAERQLNSAAQTAVGSDMSRQADAFRALNINAAQFADTLRKDPVAALKQLADAFKATGGAGGEAGPFGILLGRSLVSLVPYLRDGAEGVDKLQQAVKDLGSPTQDTLEHLDKMGEATNRLKVAAENVGIALGDAAADGGTKFLNWLTESYSISTQWIRLWSGVSLPQLSVGTGSDLQRYAAGKAQMAALGSGANIGEGMVLGAPPPSNKDQVAAWLQGAGYTPQAMAAVMGNAQVESGFNPAAKGPGGHFGMFQWDQQRQKPLGGSTDIATQMELMDRELQRLDPAFRTATGDVAELTKRFQGNFEGARGQDDAKRVAAARAADVTLPDVSVTAQKPQSVNFENSEAEKKALDQKLRALEDEKRLTDANYAYQIEAAKEDAAAQAQLAQQKGASDVAYYAQRQALINSASAAVRAQYHDEAAGAVAAKTAELAADQRAADQRVALALSGLQRKLALDQQAEASELRLAAGQLTLARATASEIAATETSIVTAHLAAQQAILASEAQVGAGRVKIEQQVAEEQARIAAGAESKQEEIDLKATEAAQRAAEAQAKPFVTAFDQIGTKFEDTITGLIDRTTTWQKAFKSILDQMLKDFIGVLGRMASGAAGSVLGNALGMPGGAGGGGGAGSSAGSFSLSGVLGGLGSKLLGDAGSSLIGNPFSGSSGGLLGGSLAGLFGGLFGAGSSAGVSAFGIPTAISALAAPFGFARGGIVPSAAGGWSVPSLGSGGTLANLHSNEMVLPANISQGLQGAINGGSLGGGGGGGVTNHNYNISAVDASGVAKLFSNNGSALVAAINRATRNGSALSTG